MGHAVHRYRIAEHRYNQRHDRTGARRPAIDARLARLLAPPARALVPFVVDGERRGLRSRPIARERLARFADVFRVTARGRVRARAADARERDGALAQVAAQLAREGALTAWRDERYAVAPRFDAPPCVPARTRGRALLRHPDLRRARQRPRRGAGGDVRMWLARRSATKAIDPGMLDNLVGGGIAAGATVAGTVIKEAWEEAGIAGRRGAGAATAHGSPSVASSPTASSTRRSSRTTCGCRPISRPRTRTARRVEHRCVALDDAARLIAMTKAPTRSPPTRASSSLDCLAARRVDAAPMRRSQPRGCDRLSTIYNIGRAHGACPMPACRIVIVGGGAIGCSIAYHLAQARRARRRAARAPAAHARRDVARRRSRRPASQQQQPDAAHALLRRAVRASSKRKRDRPPDGTA